MRRNIVLFLVATLLLVLLATVALPKGPDASEVIVHEWGTFTSVAGVKGTAASWIRSRSRSG